MTYNVFGGTLSLNQSINHSYNLVWSSKVIRVLLRCLQMNFPNNSIGFLLKGVYVLNLPRRTSKPCTLVVRHISLASCNVVYPRGLCAQPVLISFQSPSQINTWISCFSVFRSRSLECISCHYPRIPDGFGRLRAAYSRTEPTCFQLPTLPRLSICPCALILLRLRRYIRHVLTYLLTYRVSFNPITARNLSPSKWDFWSSEWQAFPPVQYSIIN